LSAVVGRTPAEAEEKQRDLDELTHPIVAREILSTILGNIDLSGYVMDGPMPQLTPTKVSTQSTFTHILDIARRGNLTLRQTAQMVAGARGKFCMRGTPEQIADVMEEWFRSEACDGFNVMPPYLPGALDDFVTLVIPELQRRGLFRTEYEGKTLRENLGLQRPESRYRKAQIAAAE
jgi:alkanesulfonate monooxygenase SsuD/methylene tetrahydromethanopterin reductase-like flavin-dependent oxidoreductase (luciferase family)